MHYGFLGRACVAASMRDELCSPLNAVLFPFLRRFHPHHHLHDFPSLTTCCPSCVDAPVAMQLGLDPSIPTVLGQLAPFLSKHYLSVTPVIARVPPSRDQHAPKPNPHEVAAVSRVVQEWPGWLGLRVFPV